MYPVYITGEVSPPINGQSLWYTFTAATPTLKRLLFPKFFDSEMGQEYALREDPRDPGKSNSIVVRAQKEKEGLMLSNTT